MSRSVEQHGDKTCAYNFILWQELLIMSRATTKTQQYHRCHQLPYLLYPHKNKSVFQWTSVPMLRGDSVNIRGGWVLGLTSQISRLSPPSVKTSRRLFCESSRTLRTATGPWNVPTLKFGLHTFHFVWYSVRTTKESQFCKQLCAFHSQVWHCARYCKGQGDL